jgi:glycosyltransferase involved in cell wall biosynthesis
VQHGKEALVIDDFDEICAAIKELATNKESAQALVQNASAFVEKYSWDAIAERYIAYS